MAARSVWRAKTKLLLAATAAGGAGTGAAMIANSEDPASAVKLCTAVPLRILRDSITAATIAFDYKYSLWGLPEGSTERTRVKSEVHARSALRLQELCFKNGGIYIKLGQHISQLEYLVPAEYVQIMRESMLNRCPVSSYDQVREVVKNELGGAPDEIFAEFDPVPIASASLAQVHIARTREGEKVAVKVQHTHMTDTAAADYATVELIVNTLHRLFPSFDYRWLIDEIRESIPKELNFLFEAKNSVKCMDNFRRFSPHIAEYVYAPKVHWNLSTSKLLVMEFIDGAQVNDLKTIQKLGIQPNDVAKLLSQAFAEMMFKHGFVHCDPHAANVLVRPLPSGHRGIFGKKKPQLILLDHGLYKDLDVSTRISYASLWKGLIFSDANAIKENSVKLGAGEDLYALFAGILTMRPWNKVIDPSVDHLVVQGTDSDRSELQMYASQYFSQITELLRRLPRVILLMLKTNDCLRTVNQSLMQGSSHETFLIVGRVSSEAVVESKLLQNKSFLSHLLIYYTKKLAVFLSVTLFGLMPIPGNEEHGVLPQQQQQQESSNSSATIPIKKRKFPIIRSPSPSPEERLSASLDNDANNIEDFKSSGKVPSLDAAIDMCSSGKSDMSKKSVLTANDASPSGKSDMSKNSVLEAKKEKATDTNVHLLQNNLDISASKPQETERCDSLGSTDGVVSKVNLLSNEKSAGSGVLGNNMGAIVVNVKKEIDSPQVEGDCKPNFSTGSGNVEFLVEPKEPLVPALEPKNSETNHQKFDKLDSSLLNLSLYRDPLVTREISGDGSNNVSSHVYANNRSNWDLNTSMDAWEPSVENNALLHNSIGNGKFNNNRSGHDLKHSSRAVGTTDFSLNKGKHVSHERSSSFPISSVRPRHEHKPEDSLCLSLGIPYRELNSSRDHSSLSDKVDSVRVDSNSKLQTGQLSTRNMNSVSCRAVKLETVDENLECSCTGGASSTMEMSRLSLMKRELIESCSSETVVPSSSNTQKVVDTRPIKSELFQVYNKEISKPADSILPQESCASSSFLSMPLTPLNSCPSRLPTFSDSTASEGLSYQSEHSFHTKHFCNKKDIPDEPIDAVIPKPVSQKGEETSLHCENVENLIAEDPERCKLNWVDEHPRELRGNSEVSASDEENTNLPTDMPGADASGTNGIHAFTNHKGIEKRRPDKEDEDYEDGELRESLMHPTVEDPNVDKQEENVKLVECDTRNMESCVFSSDKNCNISDFDGKATVLDNNDKTSSDQIKECIDMGPNERDGEDGALQKSSLDEVTEVGLDIKSSNFVSPEKQVNLSGGDHVEEGDKKEALGEGAINESHGMEATLGEKATSERIKEISLGENDSTLPKAEASVDNSSNNNNAAISSNNASNKSRIINLPRKSVAASPCKTVSIPGRLSSRSGKERCSDLEGEIQRGNRGEIYTDGPKKFVKDWSQHQSFRNSRSSFIARRGRLSGRFGRLHNEWDSNHEFASESYNVKADYQDSRRKHASSIADIELDYNGYGIAPDNSALSGGRRKALNDELHRPSARRISPRGRDGPTMRGIPMLRRIPRNVSPSRFADEHGSDMVGFRHNEKYIQELSDDIIDPVFTRPQTMYDELDDQLVRGNRNFSTLQRKDYSRARSKSPIRSRTRSPGPWPSPWRRSSPDGHPQLPQHRSPTMYRMGRMRTPDRDCFPDEVVGRRRESPTFMAQPSNDIRDVDSGREHILHRSVNSNRRTPPGRVFPRSTRRVNVLDPRERADGDDYMSGTVHSSRYHDASGDDRRKFGERRGMARSFRPAYNSDNDNVHFHHVNDGPRPFRFRPDGETDFMERSTIREREFDGRIKHQPLFVSGRMRNIEEQQDGNHRPSGQQVWHDQGFSDVSRVKRRRF
ncbi:unnamed protein product [Fraxinus pennsylvanica]|uniref:ABC1 atypical kinase-like domain-containing protein n=1 Tax=Fraxinus pennsylvanica TaxID=56036 RepID=A0AAD1Z4P8_9LAMI|nr:unnamed protein product [Fraxinus pennsylvanica]